MGSSGTHTGKKEEEDCKNVCGDAVDDDEKREEGKEKRMDADAAAAPVTGPDWINIEDDVTCIKTKRPDKRLGPQHNQLVPINRDEIPAPWKMKETRLAGQANNGNPNFRNY